MIAKKTPWGYEYLISQKDEVAIWHFFIDKDNVITFYFEDVQERMLILQALKDWRNESIHKDK